MNQDEFFMKRAIELGKKGAGSVSPNPLVGAVIVKDDVIIGEGWHEYYGGLHAEPNALNSCKTDPYGATIYVTLEPCCHYGKTGPCTQVLIKSGIKKVVIGAVDPNKAVAGKGILILRQHNIEVITGICEKECQELAEIYFHFTRTKIPYVVMKYAMTVDGKIATVTGDSKWITGAPAREHVHEIRKSMKAIMVGVDTVRVDDPMLDSRLSYNPINPIRIICDSYGRIPINSQIVKTAYLIPTYLVCTSIKEDIKNELESKGVHILKVKDKNGRVDLRNLMEICGDLGIDSILLEGGSTLNFSALEAGIVSKVRVYIAPKLIGGNRAFTPIGGSGFPFIRDCICLKQNKISLLGEDILIEYEMEGEELCLQES